MAAITDLATLTAIAGGDWLVVNDVSAGSDKKITRDDLLGGSGTWTPALTFGGASTGITYTAQTGLYNRAGNLVWISCRLTLSSKGSATGTALITGLPLPVSTGLASMSAAIFATGASIASFTAAVSSSQINLYVIAAAGASGYGLATDATFGNSTDILIAGCYRTS